MANAIVNIRGGSGSGKTSVARKFLDFDHQKMWGRKVDADKNEIKGYRITVPALKIPVMLIGSYETACGGTDSINTQEEIGDRVEAAFKEGYHVIVEGLLMSKSGPKGHISPRLRDLGGPTAWFLFLDTPADICVERVMARRAAAGNDSPLDPNRTLLPGHKQAWKSKVLLDAAGGYNTSWLEHTGEPHLSVYRMLQWAEVL